MTRAGSNRARRFGIGLLGWYPRPWRMRYEREMRALLEDMPVGWGQVANLAGTAVREWFSPRALGWPSRSAAARVATSRTFMFVALAFSLDSIARIVAAQLEAAQFTFSDTLQTNISLFMFVPFARIILGGIFRLKRVRKYRWGAFLDRPWLRYLSDWEAVVWLVLYFPWMVMHHAVPAPNYLTGLMRDLKPYENIYLVWVSSYFLVQSTDRAARLRKVHLSSFRHPLGLG